MAIIEIKIPSPGESISTVELYRWLVEDGSIVMKDTEIAELESDKATLMLVANESGKITHKASEGDILDVGAIACTIDTTFADSVTQDEIKSKKGSTTHKEAKAEEQKKSEVDKSAQLARKVEKVEQIEQKVKESEVSADFDNVKITPLAKKVMEENNLSIDDVIRGLRRLRLEDVEAAAIALKTTTDKESVKPSSLRKQAGRESTTERMSSLRRKLSERLVSVKNETAMLTTFNEVDMKLIMDIRKRHQAQFVDKFGIKLGIMSFFMKASSVALQEFPNVNSMIDGENLVTFNYTDISVAVSAPKGLMVPVVRNVESLGLADIEKEIADLALKARNGKLSIPEMTGGTFTITNGGVFGSMMSTPLINPPQSAILGMHNIIERPVAIDGQVVIRPMMYVALSYDHRVVDGKDSVSFLLRIKQLLENPTDLLFGGSSGEKNLLEL